MKNIHGFLALVCTGWLAGSLSADTFTVTRTNTTGPGSLPVIITQANATPSNHIIVFAISGTIPLVVPLPTITNNLTITGPSDYSVTISGGGTVPIFTFASGTTGTLQWLKLANGNTTGSGAAISNAGTLLVSHCVITNHRALAGLGGAIFNAGQMTIDSTSLSSNLALNGGAVFNSGILSVMNMTISNNTALGRTGEGGAIRNSGSLNMAGVNLIRNTAGYGGALYSSGELFLNSFTASENRAVMGFGGAILSSGQLILNAGTIALNSASAVSETGAPGSGAGGAGGGGGAALGGAIYISNGVFRMTNCTVSSNSATGGNGGNGSAGTGFAGTGGGGGGPDGGIGGSGIFPFHPPESGAYASGGGGVGPVGGDSSPAGQGGFGAGGGGGAGIISINTRNPGGAGGYGGGAGGDAGDMGAFNFANVGAGGGGGGGLGGGIFVESGDALLINCTVASNLCVGGLGGDALTPAAYGHPGHGVGGGVFNRSGFVSLVNTIVAGNTASNSSPDLAGAYLSSGFNLISSSGGATGLSIFDYQNEPANLGPLKDNGGPTLTHALLQGSLAIGGGTIVGAPSTDQRGVHRPQGVVPDIGAIEAVTGSPIFFGPFQRNVSGFSLSTIFDATNGYRVQASTNLTNWTVLTNFTAGGSRRFLDPAATNAPRRFYRTISP